MRSHGTADSCQTWLHHVTQRWRNIPSLRTALKRLAAKIAMLALNFILKIDMLVAGTIETLLSKRCEDSVMVLWQPQEAFFIDHHSSYPSFRFLPPASQRRAKLRNRPRANDIQPIHPVETYPCDTNIICIGGDARNRIVGLTSCESRF